MKRLLWTLKFEVTALIARLTLKGSVAKYRWRSDLKNILLRRSPQHARLL